MMNSTFKRLSVIALFATASGFAAEGDVPAALSPTNTASTSLETLVTEALEKNPELRFYEAEIEAARGGRKQAGTFPNPEVSGSAGQKTVRGPGVSDEGAAWSASVVQPFEWPGRIGLRKAIANRDIELAE